MTDETPMTLRARLKIQCDAPDGRTGTFLLDVENNRLISPLCRDLVELYRWTHAHHWTPERATVDCTDYVYRGFTPDELPR